MFAGAGLGGLLRWLIGLGVERLSPAIPLGTLFVNLAGCFFAGVTAGWLELHADLPREIRIFLITGFLGGFTTFSAFALETAALASQRAGLALGAIVVKPALCVALAWLGMALAKRF